jgi:hypothetical protein
VLNLDKRPVGGVVSSCKDCGDVEGDSWIASNRLFYWYAQLKLLEASFDANSNDEHLAEKQAELDRIEDAVSHIRFPLTFSDHVYNLRSHIDIVRRKITSRTHALGTGAR